MINTIFRTTVAFRPVAIFGAAFLLNSAGCAGGDTGSDNPFDPGPLHPCVSENGCVLEGGVSACESGKVWENPRDKDNFNCITPPGKINNWNLPGGGHADLGWNGVGGGAGPVGTDVYSTIDLNGDGLLDLVITARVQPTDNGDQTLGFGLDDTPYWFVHYNSGNGFAETGTRFTVPDGGRDERGFNALGGSGGPVGSDTWALIDMDGDLLLDLVITGRVQPTDNGDRTLGFGLADDAPYWFVHTNTGLGFSNTGVRWNLPPGGGNADDGFKTISGSGGDVGSDQWSLLDLTGDGLLDLIITSRIQPSDNGDENRGFGLADDAPYWVVHPNTGSGFSL